jgi:uncharacterized membrane protein YraQ (UPF0718 family)
MDSVFAYLLYVVAAILLTISFLKDKKKTLLSLKRAWRMFANILPQFIAILLIVRLLGEVIKPDIIQRIIGTDAGCIGMILASMLGAVTLVPAIIAFPVIAELLKNGAGITQIAVFISTLTTVGLVTMRMEIEYLGKKTALLRNMLAYLFSFITAYIIGAILA